MGLGSSVLGLTSLGAGVATLLSGRRSRMPSTTEIVWFRSGRRLFGRARMAVFERHSRIIGTAVSARNRWRDDDGGGGVLVAGGVTAYVLGAPPKPSRSLDGRGAYPVLCPFNVRGVFDLSPMLPLCFGSLSPTL